MSKTLITFTFLFFVLILLQATVLNNINIAGYATPLLYFYFILKLPSSLSSNWVITLGFLSGLSVDMFCNTPGMHALATTTAAFARHPILNLFLSRDETSTSVPSLFSMGSGSFFRYVVVMVLIHSILTYSIEAFSLFHPLTLLLKVVTGALFTIILIIGIESFNLKRK